MKWTNLTNTMEDYRKFLEIATKDNTKHYELSNNIKFNLQVNDTVFEIEFQAPEYWKYANYMPEGSQEIGKIFSKVSGYDLEITPPEAANAGYKDWFIKQYNRPGYTIEAGLGESPLPLSQFNKIYSDNIGILTLGALV